jgi:predicted metal-dependent TIM-barrel fold hydrolase
MPTVDAANHARTFGSTGAYDKQSSTVARTGDIGIEVFDASGTPIDGLIDVLDLVAQHRAILSTCHLSVAEIEQLVPLARKRGIQKIMITHPFFKVPALDLETLKRLVSQGAYAEFGYCTVSPMWNHAPLTRVVEAIEALGAEHCILMSDGGQRHNPMPAECLRVFAQCVFESGISERDVERMIKDNPLALLELPPAPLAAAATGDGAGPPAVAPEELITAGPTGGEG